MNGNLKFTSSIWSTPEYPSTFLISTTLPFGWLISFTSPISFPSPSLFVSSWNASPTANISNLGAVNTGQPGMVYVLFVELTVCPDITPPYFGG